MKGAKRKIYKVPIRNASKFRDIGGKAALSDHGAKSRTRQRAQILLVPLDASSGSKADTLSPTSRENITTGLILARQLKRTMYSVAGPGR